MGARRATRARPPGDLRRERERARRREDVLAAAERVFTLHGYHAATMADIAREADYAVGSLYKFFASKEALFEQLLEKRLAALDERVDAALASSPRVTEQLEAVAVESARCVAHDHAFMSTFVSSVPGAYQTIGIDLPVVHRHIARTQAALLEVFERGVARGELGRELSAEVMLLAFAAATRAYKLELVTRRRGALDEAEVRALVRALLRGFGARPPEPPEAGARAGARRRHGAS